MWFEVALVSSLFAVGNIFFGHFEEGTPKWRRLAKFLVFLGLSLLISATIGRIWFFVFLGAMLLFVFVIHLWWLPKHGINGWTGEPKEKYYELRGWEQKN
ncbi:MAG: hypothetical protein AAGJ81_00975 [Verrucomicrobiota bacterium]